MPRVTISLDDDLLAELDRFAGERGYAGRSEAVRDLVRGGLQQLDAGSSDKHECVAALIYAYDHHARDLAGRLTGRFHEQHDLTLATLHVHLGHDSCMEVAVLRGPGAQVREFGAQLTAERGVVYGRLVTLPVQVSTERHTHGHGPSHSHAHAEVPGTGT